ncbi:MAG: ribbon-helix-helix domain-containing protein [Nitrospinota bacterium]
MADKKLTLDLPEDLLEEVDSYKAKANKKSISEAVADLLRSALTLPDYFMNFDWDKAEKEVDELRAAGKVKTVQTAEELINDLES